MIREHLIFGLMLAAVVVTLAVTVINQGFGLAFWIWLAAFAGLGVFLWAIVRWHARAHVYECQHCKNVFAISPYIDLTSAHYPDHKSLVCPECGKRSWCKGSLVE